MAVQRNTRYIVAVVILLLCAFYFLAPSPSTFISQSYAGLPHDPDLRARVDRAESVYQKVTVKRQELIKKYGPTPAQVIMFPPDQEPWPAYTVWDFFPPAFNCPHEVERIGNLGDGGKYVCGLSRLQDKPNCIIYSFGIDWGSSFEAAILERTRHCEIWGYDYGSHGFGSDIPKEHKHRTHFHRFGLGGTDSHGPNDDPKLYTLQSLMRLNGHTHIDLLNVDLEGWEFDTLKTNILSYLVAGEPLPFAQLQIELHVWHKRFHDFLNWWETLEEAGLRPFMSEPNLVYVNYNRHSGAELAEYSFLNIKGDNVFISNGTRPASIEGEPDPRLIRHGPRD